MWKHHLGVILSYLYRRISSARGQILSEFKILDKVIPYLIYFVSFWKQPRIENVDHEVTAFSALRNSHRLQIAYPHPLCGRETHALLCGGTRVPLGSCPGPAFSWATCKLYLPCWAQLRSPLCEPSPAFLSWALLKTGIFLLWVVIDVFALCALKHC